VISRLSRVSNTEIIPACPYRAISDHWKIYLWMCFGFLCAWRTNWRITSTMPHTRQSYSLEPDCWQLTEWVLLMHLSVRREIGSTVAWVSGFQITCTVNKTGIIHQWKGTKFVRSINVIGVFINSSHVTFTNCHFKKSVYRQSLKCSNYSLILCMTVNVQ
jgi:hypothetical protein